MRKYFVLLTLFVFVSFNLFGQNRSVVLDSIVIGDPFIMADEDTQTYYMVGSTSGTVMWESKDLRNWSNPHSYIEWDKNSWKGNIPAIWAPEIHRYKGKYYCFATFTNNSMIHGEVDGRKLPRRDTHILKSDSPQGPYCEFSTEDYLDANKCTLDGTLWVEPNGKPYMVYCYEWIQAVDGRMEAVQLKRNLKAPKGKPFELFKASDTKWNDDSPVTDGPFLFLTKTGKLGMLWSSGSKSGYSQGVAYSESGMIRGPWVQDTETLTPRDHGHGMLFRTFEGRLLLICHTWHYDNKGKRLTRYPVLFEVDDSGDKLEMIGKYNP